MNVLRNLMKKQLETYGIKLVVIGIEGPDCIGKGTFAKSLTNYLTQNLDKKKFLKPILASFPDYEETLTGKLIGDILKGKVEFPSDTRKEAGMNLVMKANRNYKFHNIVDNLLKDLKLKDMGKVQIVISDRTCYSALVYSFATAYLDAYKGNFSDEKPEIFFTKLIEKFSDLGVYETVKRDALIKALRDGVKDISENAIGAYLTNFDYFRRLVDYTIATEYEEGIPMPDFIIQVNEDFDDPRSREAHKFLQDERAERLGKDLNEANEKLQEMVSLIYYRARNVISTLVKDTSYYDLGEKKDMFVAFGTNFNNTKYEEKVLEIIKAANL